MANYANLLAQIAASIYSNNKQDITGDGLQAQLNAMVASLGAGYQFMGVAHPSDTPSGYADLRAFWIAGEAGTYTNFGGLVLADSEVAVIKYDGNGFSKEVTGAAAQSVAYIQAEFINANVALQIYGEVATANNFGTTDYIPVSEGWHIQFAGMTGYSTTWASVCGYDANKGFVQVLVPGKNAAYGETSFVVPSGVSYIRASALGPNDIRYRNRFLGEYLPDVVNSILNEMIPQIDADITEVSGSVDNLARKTIMVNEFPEDSRLDGNTILGSAGGSLWYAFRSSASVVSDHVTITATGEQLWSGIRMERPSFLISGHTYRLKLSYKTPYQLSILIGTSITVATLTNVTNQWSEIDVTFTPTAEADRIQIALSYQNAASYELKDIEIYDLSISSENLEYRIDVLEADKMLLGGKKIAVIGDSISTINGGNTPYYLIQSIDVGQQIQSYVTWWDVWQNEEGSSPTGKTIGGTLLTSAMIGTLQTFTPIAEDIGKSIGVPLNYNPSSTKVWSQVLCENVGSTLIANASWSGARICSGQTGTYELSEAWSDYTIGCCKTRDENGNAITPDIIIVYRGTNDFSHGPISRIDEVSLSDGIPATDLINSLYEFRVGYYLTIQKLRAAYPKAYIICCTLNVFKRVVYDKFPTRNGIYTLPEMNDAIREIANTMGCGLIEFDKDGITFENCYSGGYITDSATIPTHPNSKGHAVMAQRAVVDINYYLNQ